MDDELIGKNILENLTTGMYRYATTIYREYIQNAADSIHKAEKNHLYKTNEEPSIDIEISVETNLIKITDNGYGVEKSQIKRRLLTIANSQKNENEDMGYRGIGRLCGLAYCKTLVFKTTFPGEDIESIMVWDAEKMRIILDDPNQNPSPKKILDEIVTYSENHCNKDDHYFVVELHDIVASHKNELLNNEKIKAYIAETAPVDFLAYFTQRTKIEKFAKDNKFYLPCYNVTLEGMPIHKPYSDALYSKKTATGPAEPYDKIVSVGFKIFESSNKEQLAWMWYGISSFDKQIPVVNEMRGIRLRRHNIELGDIYTLNDFHQEKRGNLYFIGEVHLLHPELRPNGRRDYIRDIAKAGSNSEISVREEFEQALKTFFKEELYPLYHNANTYKNAYKKENEYERVREELERKKETGFINDKEEELLNLKLQDLEIKNKKGRADRKRIEKNAKKGSATAIMITAIKDSIDIKKVDKTNDKDTTVSPSKAPEEIFTPDAKKTNKTGVPIITDRLIYLNKTERELIGRVYGVIKEVMPEDKAILVIQKIEDELNKNE